MPKFRWVISVVLCFVLLSGLPGQETPDRIAGSWLGNLDVGTFRLRVVFHLSRSESGNYSALLDSPDQGATNIPMGSVTTKGDSIFIAAPSLNGNFRGICTSDTTLTGIWEQNGRSFPLDLEKQVEEFVLERPQTPRPPYPYWEEEVEFRNTEQNFWLSGTLTLPEGEGRFPAVILVSGSGPQDRDSEILGHKTFLILADYLTRNGIAVLRYDDRGTGSSEGTLAGATTEDLAADAKAAFDYLIGREETDPLRTGIIGHSEGSMISFMLAAGSKEIAFLVSLAGPGLKGSTILLDQNEYISRLSGISEMVIRNNRAVLGHLYERMNALETYDQWDEEMRRYIPDFYKKEENGALGEDDIAHIVSSLENALPEAAYTWLRFFVQYDPRDYLGRISCPVLALNGEKDSQVLAEKNIEAIKRGVEASGNSRLTVKILPGLNHLFQLCETGLPSEYGSIEETFNPDALELVSQWILKQK